MATNEEIFKYVMKKVDTSDANVSAWQTNQQKWHKLRMRIKKQKSFPFKDCSNIRMPTAETIIKKLKALYHNLLFSVRPIVQVNPTPSGNLQTARKIEKFMDHLLMDVVDLVPKAVIALDQMEECGFYLLKPHWELEITARTEEIDLADISVEDAIAFFDPQTPEDVLVKMIVDRYEVDMSDRVSDDNEAAIKESLKEIFSGKNKVKIKLKDVTKDQPGIALVSPEKCYVPTDSGYDVSTVECISHELYIPYRQLVQNSKEKGWDKDAVEEIDGKRGLDLSRLKDTEKDLREGIERINNPSEQVKILEFYGWYDLDGDGEKEKVIITVAPEFSKVLRKISLDRKTGEWPFVKLFYELTDDRWYSHRGIVEIAEDIIKEIDVQHMQKIDQQTIRNTPQFVYRAGMVNPNLVQSRIDQAIPVHGMNPLRDTLDVIDKSNTNVEFSYEREEQTLLGRLNELTGPIDYTLQSQVNRREPRTLGEVELQFQNQQSVFSLDSALLVNQFSKLYLKIYELWCEYGPDEYEFNYFGPGQFESLKITREELQGKYKIKVRGNDRNFNPQIRMQKAQMIYQMVSNPLALQTGVVSPLQIANAHKRILQELDVEDIDSFINENPQPVPNPETERQLMDKFGELTDAEQAQILQKRGIKPDPEGRLHKKQQELLELGVKANGKARTA